MKISISVLAALLLFGCSNTSVFVPLEGPVGIKIEKSDPPPPVIVNQHPE
jgi:hypothetical protein